VRRVWLLIAGAAMGCLAGCGATVGGHQIEVQTTGQAPPSVPPVVSAQRVGTSQVVLTWAPVSSATAYDIYRIPGAVHWDQASPTQPVAETTFTSWTDTTLDGFEGKTLTYWVVPRNTAGTGPHSAAVWVSLPSLPNGTPLAVPQETAPPPVVHPTQAQTHATSPPQNSVPGQPLFIPGHFGILVQDPPADWTVRGCEIVWAAPGSPAAQAGLVGARNRVDPVGDVIQHLIVGVEGRGFVVNAVISNCADLESAMQQVSANTDVQIQYAHRVVTGLVGHWEREYTVVATTAQAYPGTTL